MRSVRTLGLRGRICLSPRLTAAHGRFYSYRSPSTRRPSIGRPRWRRNINLLSIVYAFRPRLRNRLTLGGITFPRKP